MIHQNPIDLIADTEAFASPRQDPSRLSTAAMISGKASRFLARNVRTKTLTMRNPRPLVTFTFDDVPISACTTGARILEQHGVRATYYVSGGGCGRASPSGLLASTGHLKTLWLNGHEIACHTFSHPAVSDLESGALANDLDRNAAFLKSIDRDIVARNFAYPYGDISFRAKLTLQRRFDSCRSLTPGLNAGTADLGTLKTQCLESLSTGRVGFAGLIAETVRKNGWLIFCGHDIGDEPGRFGTSPTLLSFAIATAKSAGCSIVTVADALTAMARPGSEAVS